MVIPLLGIDRLAGPSLGSGGFAPLVLLWGLGTEKLILQRALDGLAPRITPFGADGKERYH
jgi:hypothetical protein